MIYPYPVPASLHIIGSKCKWKRCFNLDYGQIGCIKVVSHMILCGSHIIDILNDFLSVLMNSSQMLLIRYGKHAFNPYAAGGSFGQYKRMQKI